MECEELAPHERGLAFLVRSREIQSCYAEGTGKRRSDRSSKKVAAPSRMGGNMSPIQAKEIKVAVLFKNPELPDYFVEVADLQLDTASWRDRIHCRTL